MNLQNSFRPSLVKVLFIGESRPSNGTFFYRGDSRLARYTREAILDEHEDAPPAVFLERFRSMGCFLVDLCEEPVNWLSASERRIAREAGETKLAKKLEKLQPLAIIVVMKGIAQSVERACRKAKICVPRHVLPFPAQGHERQYVVNLHVVIKRLKAKGVL